MSRALPSASVRSPSKSGRRRRRCGDHSARAGWHRLPDRRVRRRSAPAATAAGHCASAGQARRTDEFVSHGPRRPRGLQWDELPPNRRPHAGVVDQEERDQTADRCSRRSRVSVAILHHRHGGGRLGMASREMSTSVPGRASRSRERLGGEQSVVEALRRIIGKTGRFSIDGSPLRAVGKREGQPKPGAAEGMSATTGFPPVSEKRPVTASGRTGRRPLARTELPCRCCRNVR